MSGVADSIATSVPRSMRCAVRDHERRCVYPGLHRRESQLGQPSKWFSDPSRPRISAPSGVGDAALPPGPRQVISAEIESRALWDLYLVVVAPPAWVHPSPKVRAVSGVRAKTHGEPEEASTAMRCVKRVLNTGDGKSWLASGASQFNCCALRPSRGKPASSLTRHKANCTTRVIPRARPQGPRQNRFSDRKRQRQVTTATPFLSRDGNRARSLSSTIS